MTPLDESCVKHTPVEWHSEFLAMMPCIQRSARCAFRRLPPEAKEEAVAETIANVFVAYLRLVETGKQHVAHPHRLATYAISQIWSGRRVGGSLNSHDVMSQTAQRHHGFSRESWFQLDSRTGEWNEMLLEDSATPVPDQAAFRCDFPEWLALQPQRDRQVAEALAVGHTTSETAFYFNLSRGRVSQLRHEFEESWREFQGESDEHVSSGLAMA